MSKMAELYGRSQHGSYYHHEIKGVNFKFKGPLDLVEITYLLNDEEHTICLRVSDFYNWLGQEIIFMQ